MNRKTETAEFPYADRPMWLYRLLAETILYLRFHLTFQKVNTIFPVYFG